MGVTRTRRRAAKNSTAAGSRSIDDLLIAAAGGDTDAFGLLYDQLAPIVYGVCHRLLKDPASAQVAAEESFVELWRQAPRFDSTHGPVHGWARTIALHCAADSARRSVARTI